MTRPVRHTRLSAEGRPGWALWCQAFDPLFRIRPADALGDFQARLDAFDLPGVILTRMAFGGVRQTGVRPDELIRRGGLDHYSIEFCIHAPDYHCESRHGSGPVPGGALVLMDLAQPQAMTATRSDSISLTVPRATLDALCPGLDRLHGRPIGGPGGVSLLGDHLLALHRHLPAMTPSQADEATEATLALTVACLAPTADRLAEAGDVLAHTRLARARDCIETRLDDPELGPAQLCQALGTSRSNLYRLFRPLGGVRHYIQQRRLERAHQRLCQRGEHRSISELAYDQGFTSAAHFSRAFRARFGYAPSDARDRPSPPEPPERAPDTPTETVATWLERLHRR